MADIEIRFKDGTTKNFKHEGRPGGSYTKSLKYEGSFAIVEDEWGNRVAYPVQDIAEIKENRNNSGLS